MKRPLTLEEVAEYKRRRYACDYRRLMEEPPHIGRGRRMKAPAADPKVMAACYRRDKAKDAVCWLCKQPIDYTVKRSSTEDAWEGDHYHPRSTHPELKDEPSNILPAHRRCNRARHTKAGLNEMGERSREW